MAKAKRLIYVFCKFNRKIYNTVNRRWIKIFIFISSFEPFRVYNSMIRSP